MSHLSMNYLEQEKYLRSSRIAALMVAALLLVLAVFYVQIKGRLLDKSAIVLILIMAAVAVSICYTPDYLHLTVSPNKPARWEIKIRWRVVVCALVIGLFFCSNRGDVLVCFAAVAWLVVANWLARRTVGPDYFPLYFWFSDLALIAFLVLARGCGALPAVGLLALAVHLSVVINELRPLQWAAAVTVCSWLLMLPAARGVGAYWTFLLVAGSLLFVAAMGTAWLVKRACRQNTRNIWKAMGELVGFTDYSVEEVWRRWRESDKELARNWVQAAPDENDRAALAEWYRQNSELYMFAISGYNLDYKRICSNLKVLRKAQGACLDYGAGNGEIVLELARRGHASTYYDVEGQSAKFAQYRAQKQKLDVKFRFSKETLAGDRFDTIFSLDVLEHIPDLQAELNFLSSLLNAGGLLLFDVPAGATHSHPMHLNHNVDFRSLLRQKGMNERRSFWYALPFVKQEKFVFETGKAILTTDQH